MENSCRRIIIDDTAAQPGAKYLKPKIGFE